MLPLIAVVVLDTDDDATANVAVVLDDAVNEALVVADVVLAAFVDGDCGDSEFGDEGGEVFISSNNGDLLVVALIFGAPFNAELLANCK